MCFSVSAKCKVQNAKCETVRLSEIGSDERFRITTRTDIEELSKSVRNAGLMSMPILFQTSRDFIIVCGFRRIAACRFLEIREIPARILAEDTDESECVTFAVTDNAFQRSMNLIEISRSLHKLSTFYDNEKELCQAAADLGLPSNPSVIRKLRPLCMLSLTIQEGILSESVALPVALEIGEIEETEGIAVAELFKYLNPSLNKQREILTMMKEIALRENISLSVIITDIDKILKNSDTDRNQKLNNIRLYLKQRRYPVLTRAENDFEQLLRELGIGSGIDLIPPKYFEGSVYTLALQFKTKEELNERKMRLDRIVCNPALKAYLG